MAATLARQRVAVALLAVDVITRPPAERRGIFALVANVVAQRTREIGILMALGSTIPQTMIRVGRMGVSASGLGMVLGLVFCAGGASGDAQRTLWRRCVRPGHHAGGRADTLCGDALCDDTHPEDCAHRPRESAPRTNSQPRGPLQ